MDVTRKQLEMAAAKEIISPQQAIALYEYLQAQSQDTARFTFTHVLYYFGGLIAIGAMTLFMNLGWESFGGAGIVGIAIVYALIGLKITHVLAAKKLVIPAGICATFVVCLAPLAIYGIQQWLGIWPDESHYRDYHRLIKWHWLYMELGTLLVGVIIAKIYRYPFLLMPIAVTLWYMTMDITAMLFNDDISWEMRKIVSLYAGLVMIALAFWVDIRSRHQADYAFWIYLFGALAFWGGLSSLDSDSEIAKLYYCGINLLMIAAGAILLRRIFVILGAIGICMYLSHLAADIFKDSWLFPITLTAIGLGIIYLGILWQKHEHTITRQLRGFLPQLLRQLLEEKS